MSRKFNSVESKHIYVLTFINAIVAISAVMICLYFSYYISLTQNENRLRELAQNQARIIESVSEFDMYNFTNNIISQETAWQNTMLQIQGAHEKYEGFGQTGEFTLAKKVDDKIIFLLSHRHFDSHELRPVSLHSNFAEPMKAALNGKSGVMQGKDYRGEMVVAAYEPVNTHMGLLGIVAKIDLKELQRPYLNIAFYFFVGIVTIMLVITWYFFKYITPILEKNKSNIAKLEKSEQLLSTSQNIAHIASWNLSLENYYLESSLAMYKLFHIQEVNELNSLNDILKKIHKEDYKRVQQAFETLENDTFNEKFRILIPGNEIRYMHAVGKVIRSDSQDRLNVIGVIRDVTQETLDQKNLVQQEQMLSTIFDNSPALIVLLDESANIVNTNQYTLQLLGYVKKEVLMKNWFDFIIEKEHHEKAKSIFNQLLNGKKTYLENISNIVTHYGVTRTIQWRNSLIDDGDNKYILSVGLDITKTLYLETKYKDLYERMLDGFVITDLENNIIECNPALCKMLDYSQEELLNKNLADITPSKWFALEMKYLQTLGKDRHTSLYEKEYLSKDGKTVPVELRVGTIQNPHNVTIGYWALIRDISERKIIEKELQKKDEMMIAQSRQVAMGDMIAMIAHQWRQPISTVTMVANNITMDLDFEEEFNKESLKKDMQKIIEQTSYLSNTIDDFRSFFNPSNEKSKVLISEILEDSLKIIGKSLENNNIAVEKKVHSNIELELLDKEMLQVLLVILNNAKDAIVSHEIKHGQISIEIGDEANNVYLKICDNGGGISKTVLSRLGEPYLTTKVEHGTGLGLYMSSIIIRKHMEGELMWYNTNDGACIEIRLPIIKAEYESS